MKHISNQLPATGLIRANDLLPFLPFKKSSLWAFSKDGRFPAPIKVCSMTCWRLEQVHAWFAAQGQIEQTVTCHAGGQ
jgi:prophage regulatory protein